MHKLSSDTVRLISSSQVVTSVSSAVKELVENALDAKATSIDVKLDNWGLEKIEVRDNGCGIKKCDTAVMAQRFYTSKISKHEDLCHLSTYGFRGEALGSLCQVSNVGITTKTAEDNVAVCYVLDRNGQGTSSKPTHGGNGTTVVASNIFKNLPVRKQFYSNTKKCKEEFKKIEDILMAYGLINSGVRLSLKNNKTLAWQKNKSCDMRGAIIDTLGVQVCNQLEYLECYNDELSLTLKCFLPKICSNFNSQLLCRSSGERCYIFINNRYVIWKELVQVFKKYFSSASNNDRIPLCLISLDLPPEDVDANLEPNKTKVLVKQKDEILEFFSKQLSKLYERDNCNNIDSNDVGEITKSNINDDNAKVCERTRSTAQNEELNQLKSFASVANGSIESDTEQSATILESNLGIGNVSSRTDMNILDKDNVTVSSNCNVLRMTKPSEIVVEGTFLPDDPIVMNRLLQNDDLKEPINHDNIASMNDESSEVLCLNPSQRKESAVEDLLNDLENDWTILDDTDFNIAIDLSLPNQEQWSKGQGLFDKNGNNIQPTNILVPRVQSKLANETQEVSLSVLNGKRKLSNKDSSPKLSIPRKRVKKLNAKIIGQPSLTSLLRSPTTTKLAKTRKRTSTMEVSFSLSSLKLTSNNREDSLPSDDIQLIKRLDPWGVWVISRKRKLFILNPYRLQELLLYKRLTANHIIAREKLGKAITLNERILGSVTRYCFLEKLVMGSKDRGNTKYCDDKRLVANGFEICGRRDHENGKTKLEIVKMNTTVPYFGVQDLIEIIDLIKDEESLHLSSNNVQFCRPSKVRDFLKNEVVRVARGLSSKLTEADIISILANAKKELKDEDDKCVHDLPFLHPLMSY